MSFEARKIRLVMMLRQAGVSDTRVLAAIERIEILQDGASAIYGADAVAGVVNIITKRAFDGVEFATRYGKTAEGDGADSAGAAVVAERQTGSAPGDRPVSQRDPAQARATVQHMDPVAQPAGVRREARGPGTRTPDVATMAVSENATTPTSSRVSASRSIVFAKLPPCMP